MQRPLHEADEVAAVCARHNCLLVGLHQCYWVAMPSVALIYEQRVDQVHDLFAFCNPRRDLDPSRLLTGIEVEETQPGASVVLVYIRRCRGDDL